MSKILASEIRTDGHPVVVTVDPTNSPERHLLCLSLETVLERFGDDGVAGILTSELPPCSRC